MTPLAQDNLLKFPEVKARVRRSTSAIYRGIENGTFPRPIKYGTSTNAKVLWLESEITAWLQARIDERGDAYAKPGEP